MPVQTDLRDLRLRYRRSLADCAAVLRLTPEAYRLKEAGKVPITGGQLALLADFYGMPLHAAFPSYQPTAAEVSLARHLNRLVNRAA